MEAKKNLITRAGYEKLEQEREYLKTVKHPEISQKIKEAREQGDLSENAEYEAARDEQAKIQGRIEEIDEILKNSVFADDDELDNGKISIGSSVIILDTEEDEELEYKIVGTTETDSLHGKISNESPVGAAMMGKVAGDVITVETQMGDLEYKILKVWKED